MITLQKKDKVSPKNPTAKDKHHWNQGIIVKFNMDEDEALILTDDGRSFWLFTYELAKVN